MKNYWEMTEEERHKRDCENCSRCPCDSRDRILVAKCQWDDYFRD